MRGLPPDDLLSRTTLDTSRFIAQWTDTEKKPAKAAFDLEWLPGVQGFLEYFYHAGKIVRMDSSFPAPG
jgi:hypothetical protein